MEYVEGLLAFSVVMIVLSTIVSGIVEVIMRAFAVRGWLLQRTIKLMLEEHLIPRIAASGGHAGSARAPPPPVSTATLDILTANPSVSGRDGRRTTVEELSAWAFLQRLANTEHGRDILGLGLGDEAAEALLSDAIRTFERYTAAGKEALRHRANTIALIVGLVMGPALNIHAPDLLDQLVKNAPARNALIAQGEATGEAYQVQSAALQRAIDDLASPGPVVSEAALAALSDAATRLEKTSGTVKDLKELNLPILYDRFPYTREAGADHGWSAWIWWGLGVLLRGLLIGLGGPFWYRVFQSLSALTRLLKGLGGASPELAADPAAEKESIVGPPPDALNPAKLLPDFKIAAGPEPGPKIARIYE